MNPSRASDFSFRDIPLQGRHLIQASAGTGKTWTLTALYLRLLIERDLTVEQILVVTFTEAATRELKNRIREKLQGALERLRQPVEPDGEEDPFDLLPAADSDEGRRVYRLLNRALRNMDRAAVHTIHGFCSRILRDHAFASGLRFDVSVRVDDGALQQEIVDDFWRVRVPGLPGSVVRYLAGRLDPDRLLRLLKPLLQHPDGHLDCAAPVPDLARLEAGVAAQWKQLQEVWARERGEISRFITGFEGFNRRRIADGQRGEHLAALERFMEDCPDPGDGVSGIPGWRTSLLGKWINKGFEAPPLDFFDQLDGFADIFEKLILALQAEEQQLVKDALDTLKRELPERKNALGEIGFQDMLLKLREALDPRGDGGEVLQRRLRELYRAALIDEFQDTDPVQWDIFRLIFQDGETSPFYLIGDPKQAIYGFRGGDIHTYLAAARGCSPHELRYNRRSIPGLVRAVNRLFTVHQRPFVTAGIEYQEVESRAENRILREPGLGGEESLIIVYPDQRSEKKGKPTAMKTIRTREMIRDLIGDEILRLLDLARRGEAWFDEPSTDAGPPRRRALKAGDLAVLVKTNQEANQVLAALDQRGINAVIRQSGDVFKTPEADDWLLLLTGLLQPGSIGCLRGVLTSHFFEFSCGEIVRMEEDPQTLGSVLALFRELRKTWERWGVMSLLRLLMERLKFPGRLAGVPGGERRLANILQIGELLHEVEYREKPGVVGLLRWLEQRMAAPDSDPVPDEHMLRLASEEDAVGIVTMHASKGLEYPVVFCASTWEGMSRSPGSSVPVMCHDPRPPFQGVVLDLGGERYPEHQEAARQQQLAEWMRLLYVAVTRGRSRVYLFGAPVKHILMSPLEYLLFHADGQAGNDSAGDRGREVLRSTLESLREGVPSLHPCERLPGLPVDAVALSGADPGLLPQACRFDRDVVSGWRIASFTSLSRHDEHAAELADRDDADLAGEEQEMTELDDLLPRGRLGGNLFHALMEEIDFSLADGEGNRQICHRVLRRHGQSLENAAGLLQLAERVLKTPLDEHGFLLQSLPAHDRQVELEFHFPLDPDPDQEAPGLFSRLDLRLLNGFLKGFIDLIFRRDGRYYLLDWKTNNLGPTAGDYSPGRMDDAILQCNYNLQQAVYSVALHRHLRASLADYNLSRDFGGIYYLFVRGMDPQRGCRTGVWYRPPREDELLELDRWLGGGK